MTKLSTKLRKWYPVCLYDGSKFVSIKKDEVNRHVRLVGTHEMRFFLLENIMAFHRFGLCCEYLLYVSLVRLGAFAKLRKLTSGFVVSVCLPVRPH
jgi:hypothetical protein